MYAAIPTNSCRDFPLFDSVIEKSALAPALTPSLSCLSARVRMVFPKLPMLVVLKRIIAVIILLRTTSIGSFGKTILTLAERHEREGVSAGANALFSMTESKSGKSLQEFVGIAAYIGNDTIDFGPSISYVDVPQEITWRLDALYGKDHWYMRVPYPKIEAAIQIIFIQDTSSSLCDDVENLRKVLPGLISDLRAAGKRVTATIYLLEG